MVGQTVSHYRIFEKLGDDGVVGVYPTHYKKLNHAVVAETVRTLVAILTRAAFSLHYTRTTSLARHTPGFVHPVVYIGLTENPPNWRTNEV